MQTDASDGGGPRRQALGHQAGDEARQHIPHAPGGHARIAGAVDPDGPLFFHHQAAGALEERRPAKLFPHRGDSGEAVRLQGLDAGSQQPGRLAGVRSQHPVLPALRVGGQQVQGVGVHHHGQACLQGLREQARGPIPLA